MTSCFLLNAFHFILTWKLRHVMCYKSMAFIRSLSAIWPMYQVSWFSLRIVLYFGTMDVTLQFSISIITDKFLGQMGSEQITYVIGSFRGLIGCAHFPSIFCNGSSNKWKGDQIWAIIVNYLTDDMTTSVKCRCDSLKFFHCSYSK